LEDRLKDEAGPNWRRGLEREVGWQKLRPKRPRHNPQVKKATRSRWPKKEPDSKPTPPTHQAPPRIARILLTDGSY
jgi:hypothetical protein